MSSTMLHILPGSVGLYALESDVQARGLPIDDLPRRVMLIDYPQMVELCISHDKVLSW